MGRAHGTAGELQIVPMTDRMEERFSEGSELFLNRREGEENEKLRVKSARGTGKGPLVIFEGYESREQARTLTGSELLIPGEMLSDPGPDAYYGFQLEGCMVYEAGTAVGRVVSLEQSRANPYLVVEQEEEGAEVCIPFVRDVILSVDTGGRRIDIIEGFLG